MNNIIELNDIYVAFEGEQVLNGLSLSIKDKEFITLLGPSGCGKTTTLRILAGFLDPDKGDMFFEGKKLNSVPAYKRQVNTIFQRYALFPHLNVFENIAFGLRVKKLPEEEIKQRVLEMLSLVNLEGFEKRKIHTLSGGQQQRVAIARAIAKDAPVVLLDEPTSALDGETAEALLRAMDRLTEGKTVIHVTHREETIRNYDRILVLKEGKLFEKESVAGI